jgi:hypothetical protein
MASLDTAWYYDPDTLDALARETAEYLKHLHGVGRRFATNNRPCALGQRTWLNAYAESARFWFLPIEDAALISALCTSDAQQFQSPQAQTRMQQWWNDVTREDAEHRRRATRLARVVAEALDPSTTHPAPLDRRRVYALYADRRRINRFYARLVERFESPPPISWLPVIPDDDYGYITMRHARWVRAASVKFLAAFLGADEESIRRVVKRAQPRRDA